MHPTRARFPAAAEDAGLYESFFLKAAHPSDPLGVWIRYTVHKRPREQAKGSLWFTLFDASADGPRASKVTLPRPSVGEGAWIRIGEARLQEGEASGSAPSELCDAAWNLRFRSADRPLLHLPYEWMYQAGGPAPNALSPL